MKIGVVGMWHLGIVTAACLAEAGFEVTAFDSHEETIARLRKNILPISEPGVAEAMKKHEKNLRFTTELAAISSCDIIWIAMDTPVDAEDNADEQAVISAIESLFPFLKEHAIVIISSQLPVGSTKRIEELWKKKGSGKHVSFAYSPENLRLGKAMEYFRHPDRIVVGMRNDEDKSRLEPLFSHFTKNIIWMRVESAEMTKHAINAFLATSVVFANELANLCEKVGADAFEVEKGLKSEERIGPKAYVKPGAAFAGGTLARDIQFLISECKDNHLDPRLFQSVFDANDAHKLWAVKKLEDIGLKGKTIAVLGLTYKPGTDTLRRSSSVEMCRLLAKEGAIVKAFDPAIKNLPADLAQTIHLEKNIEDAITGADALVIATPWPEFRSLRKETVLSLMKKPFVLDPAGFLSRNLIGTDLKYVVVGKN